MPMVRLAGTDLSVSRLIFGTGSLFNVGGQRARLALLEAAVQSGFTHFDTAPYYGFGWAERDLGLLLRSHPNVTVTTKVGLYSPGGEDAWRCSVIARKALGRLFPAISRPAVDFSVARAQQALSASLRRLGREHVEIFMLHEPLLRLVRIDEWHRWLETEVARGRVGAFGLALTSDRLAPFLDGAPALARVVQVQDSLDGQEADCLTRRGRVLQITYGYVSAARKQGSLMPVSQVMGASLLRNQTGAIVVSTTKIERVPLYAEITRQAS